MGNFDTMNNISDNVTLVQMVDSLVNMNHVLSVLMKWIFDSNDKNPRS